MPKNELKNATAITKISSNLLGKKEGDRIDTVAEFCDNYGLARGTVQTAIQFLTDSGAISLKAHGHLGSFLTMADYRKLLSYAGIKSLYCSMPLPYTKRYEGLATGISNELKKSGIVSGITFMSGSEQRIAALLEGRCDCALLSQLAAQRYSEENSEVEILHTFSPDTYVSGHYLITRKGFDIAEARKLTVGIDSMSYDQRHWVDIVFKDKDIELVPLKYIHVLDNIREGKIDATVWGFEEQYFDSDIEAVKLEHDEIQRNTSAALAVCRGNSGVKNCLERIFDYRQIERTQADVLNNAILPNY